MGRPSRYVAGNPLRLSRSKQVSPTRAISRRRFAVPRAQHPKTGSEVADSDLGLNRAARCPAAEKSLQLISQFRPVVTRVPGTFTVHIVCYWISSGRTDE